MRIKPKIGIRPNNILVMREFFLIWLGHLRFGKRSKKLGLSSPFLGVPCSIGKKRRSLVQVFEDQGMDYLLGLGKTLTFFIHLFWVGLSSILKVGMIFDKNGQNWFIFGFSTTPHA